MSGAPGGPNPNSRAPPKAAAAAAAVATAAAPDGVTALFHRSHPTTAGLLQLRAVVTRPAQARARQLLVCDRSGSMAGGPWRQMQGALTHIRGTLAPTDRNTVPVVLYDGTAARVTLDGALSARCGGLTNFEAAFTATTDALAQMMAQQAAHPHPRPRPAARAPAVAAAAVAALTAVVIFMTDGKHTVAADGTFTTSADTTPMVARFKAALAALAARGLTTTVHVLGFGRDHDLDFLEAVRHCGTVPGVFRYAEGGDLEDKLAGLFDVVDGDSGAGEATVVVAGVERTVPTEVVRVEPVEGCPELERATLEAQVWLPAAADGGAAGDAAEGKEGAPEEPATATTAPELAGQALLFRVEGHVFTMAGERVRPMPIPVFHVQRLALRVAKLNARMGGAAAGAVAKGAAAEAEMAACANELTKLQKQLGHVKLFGAGMSKAQRAGVGAARADLQEQLDAHHALVAERARAAASDGGGGAAGGKQNVSVLGRMADLRFAAKFTKSRRARAMATRAARNGGHAGALTTKLAGLAAELKPADFAGTDLDLFHCDLSVMNVEEIMHDDPSDVLGFGLNVSRPEHAVDAPTLVVVHEVGSTLCARSAVEDAVRFSISIRGHRDTHGGFGAAVRADGADVADGAGGAGAGGDKLAHRPGGAHTKAFSGRANEPINAFLPLFVNEAHWARVSAVLEPMLGMFFTLDPLGYDAPQLLGLYMVLGNMIAQSNGTQRARFLIREFATVCARVLPPARAYLGHDLVAHFVAHPAGRSKGAVQNLIVVVGWAAALVREEEEAAEAAAAGLQARASALDDVQRPPAGPVADLLQALRVPLIAEAYRRELNRLLHGTPPNLVEAQVEALLYGPAGSGRASGTSTAADAAAAATAGTANAGKENCPPPGSKRARKKESAADALCAAWAQHTLGRKKGAVAKPSLLAEDREDDDAVRAQYAARKTRAVCPDAVVAEGVAKLLDNIARRNERAVAGEHAVQTAMRAPATSPGADGSAVAGATVATEHTWVLPMGFFQTAVERLPGLRWSLTPAEARCALVQGLRLHSNAKVNQAVGATPCEYHEVHTPEGRAAVLNLAHGHFAGQDEGRVNAQMEAARVTLCARRVATAPTLWSFAGRLLLRCPTRGGDVFTSLVEQLQQASSDAVGGEAGAPGLVGLDPVLTHAKVEMLFTGVVKDPGDGEEGKEFAVLAQGNAWLADALVMRKFREAMGTEHFDALMVRLRGRVCAHVYRVSDIPNRHGHHTSNPYKGHIQRFMF